MSKLENYIWSQLWTPFVYALFACLALSFSAGALVDVMRQIAQGLNYQIALQFLCFQLVLSVLFSLPASCLFGGVFAYSQLELMALRTSGIGVARWLKPSLIFGCVIGTFGWQWNEWALPVANYSVQQLQQQIQLTTTSTSLLDQIDNQVLYVQKWTPFHMSNCVLWQFDEQGYHLWMAQHIYWKHNHWMANDLIHYEWNRQQQLQTQTHVAEIEFQPIHQFVWKHQWKPIWMNVQSLKSYQRICGINQHLAIRYYQKYAFAITCGLFHLIGSSLASVSKQAFILSLVVLFGYYLFGFGCEALAESRQISALMAAWTPVAALFLVLCLCIKQAHTTS
nr:hypothetical protein [Cyanidioschyzonaceae sp. 1]